MIGDFEFYQLKTSILMEEYKMLVDCLKDYYTRRQNGDTIFLGVDTLLVTVCAYILGVAPPETKPLLIPLCIIGIVASMAWIFVSERVNLETNLKYFQLRCAERDLNRTGGIFISGYDFFFNRKTVQSPDGKETMEFPKGIIGVLFRFRAVWTDRVLPIIFICLYICILIYVMS